MNENRASDLYEMGRAHALSAQLLHKAAVEFAEKSDNPEPEKFAFNGPYSPSIHYLIGLGMELILKAAYLAVGGPDHDEVLRKKIGHDLGKALEYAENQGFKSEAPRLAEIVGRLREPYKRHFFRYDHPEQFALHEINQVMEAFAVLDDELEGILRTKSQPE